MNRTITTITAGAGIAHGRNLAIEATTCELIAVTDAGVRLEPDWLETLVSALRGDVDVEFFGYLLGQLGVCAARKQHQVFAIIGPVVAHRAALAVSGSR